MTEKEIIKAHKLGLKNYLKSCNVTRKFYYDKVQGLMKKGDHKAALKLLKNCPDRLAQVGLENMVKSEIEKKRKP